MDLDELEIDIDDLLPKGTHPRLSLSPAIVPMTLPETFDMGAALTLTKEAGRLFDFSESRLNPIQQTYIVGYATKGLKTEAAKLAGVSLKTVDKWMQQSTEFRETLQHCVDIVTEALEAEAIKRAMQGSDRLLIKLLEALNPDKYQKRSKTDVSVYGEIVHSWADLAQRAEKILAIEGRVSDDDTISD